MPRRDEKTTNQNTTMITVVLAVCCLCLPGQCQTVLTPEWLTWLGNGTSDYACTSGTCNLAGENWFRSFTVSSGAKVLNNAAGPLIVYATGICTIDGTISGSPNSGSPGIPGNGDFGGGGGGGGGGTLAGTGGKTTVVVSGIPIVNGGPGGSAAGGAGHNAVSVVQGQYRMLLSSGSPWPGGGALGGQGGSGGGAGGHGGTPVIFICHTIEFSGSIDVSGGNGRNAPADNTGAGGGGGGGYVLFSAVSYTQNAGTISMSGGVGGSCNGHLNCGGGGNGGNGFSISMTIK
jgi:hypothetical protein